MRWTAYSSHPLTPSAAAGSAIYFNPGCNLHRSFRVWRWVRGQEYDPYRSGPLRKYDLEDFVKPTFDANWRRLAKTCLISTEPFEEAHDHYCAQLAHGAMEWLEANQGRLEPVLLWADSFDPHEPWTPPREFDTCTDPSYSGKQIILPCGGLASPHFTEEEMAHIKGLHASEVAYVDHYIGQLLAELQELGYYEDSVIVLVAVIGHQLVEDPGEQHNLIDEHPEEAIRLARAFGPLYAVRGVAVKGTRGRYEVDGSAAG
jgi:hypothetical protein